MEYAFNIEHAVLYGVYEAVMIKNFQFWIMKNKANNVHSHDGRYWTYNSISAFEKQFPFWSRDQIRRILKSLTDQGILLVGNYNKLKMDRTLWYAFQDEKKFLNTPKSKWRKSQMHLAKTTNAFGENPKPIPDTDSDTTISPYGDMQDSDESCDDPTELPDGNSTDHQSTNLSNNRLNNGSSPKSKINGNTPKKEDKYFIGSFPSKFRLNNDKTKELRSKWKIYVDRRNESTSPIRSYGYAKTLIDSLYKYSQGNLDKAIQIVENATHKPWNKFIPLQEDKCKFDEFKNDISFSQNGSKTNGTSKPSNLYQSESVSHDGIIPRKLEKRALSNLDRYFHDWYLDDIQENVSFGDDNIKTLRQAFEAGICDVCDPKTFESKGDDWKKYRKFPSKSKSRV